MEPEKRIGYMTAIGDKLLQILAEHAPEDNDDIVIDKFRVKIIPRFEKEFASLTPDQQYYVALLDRLPNEVLFDIKNNRAQYKPLKPKPGASGKEMDRFYTGLHDISNTLLRLEKYTGVEIEDRTD